MAKSPTEMQAYLYILRSKWPDLAYSSILGVLMEELIRRLEAGEFRDPHGMFQEGRLTEHLRSFMYLVDLIDAEDGDQTAGRHIRSVRNAPCLVCGKGIPQPDRPGRQREYCSNACRQRAYRQRSDSP